MYGLNAHIHHFRHLYKRKDVIKRREQLKRVAESTNIDLLLMSGLNWANLWRHEHCEAEKTHILLNLA